MSIQKGMQTCKNSSLKKTPAPRYLFIEYASTFYRLKNMFQETSKEFLYSHLKFSMNTLLWSILVLNLTVTVLWYLALTHTSNPLSFP